LVVVVVGNTIDVVVYSERFLIHDENVQRTKKNSEMKLIHKAISTCTKFAVNFDPVGWESVAVNVPLRRDANRPYRL
jgi:hypothetical protein